MSVRQRVRQEFYRVWARLPKPLQELLIYLGSRKVTMGVAAIITDERGRLLLVRHTYGDPPWGTPGGLVGAHEEPRTAVAREVWEELGLHATVGPVLNVFYDGRYRRITIFYQVQVAGTPRHDVETDADCYVAVEALPEYLGRREARWLRRHVLSRLAL